MKFYAKLLLLLLVALPLIGSSLICSQAFAKIGDVGDLTNLSGAYQGKMASSGKKVKVIMVSQTQKLGTYIVVLLSDGDTHSTVFDGELISDSQSIGLSSLGLSQDGTEIEATVPPAALMQIDSEHIEIIPQSGTKVLTESVILDSAVRGVSIVAPRSGEYVVGASHVTVGGNGFVKLALPQVGLNGQFTMTFDVGNVGVLRGVSFDSNYQTRESEKVSGFVIGLTQGNKSALLVGLLDSQGQASSAVFLKQK